MIVRHEFDSPPDLTEEEKVMLERSKDKPIVYDRYCRKLTDKELSEFRRASEINHERRKRVTLTLRLPKSTVDKAKSLGKGYTSVLSRILEAALNDNEILEKYL